MQDNEQNNSPGQGLGDNDDVDAGSFGGGNEGSTGIHGNDPGPVAGSESATGGSGESGTVGGPHGGADDIGRSGTGSAMTGQTSILNDDD
jgi:hypothetical protein